MAQNGLPTLHVDPNLLARELDTSLSLANRSPTGPDDEALLRDASKRLGIPLDTARSNPQETKRAVESSAVDLADYARRFPSTAHYLANPDNALVSRDDLGPLSEVEQTLRAAIRQNMLADVGVGVNTGQAIVEKLTPGYSAEVALEREVLRTQGFAAAAKLRREHQLRREAELARNTGFATPIQQPEPTLGNILSGLASGTASAFRSQALGLQQQFGDIFDDPDTPEARARTERYNRARAQEDFRASLKRPEFDYWLSDAAYGGFESLAQTLPALTLSIGTGSPVPGLLAIGTQTYGEAYGRYRGRGAERGAASMGASGEAAVEVLTEILPMKFAVERFGKAGLGDFLTGLLAREVPGEQIATLVQDAIDTAIANPDKTWAEYWAERPDAAGRTLIASLVQSGTVAAVGEGAGRLAGTLDRKRDEIDEARAAAQHLQQLLAAAGRSATRQRTPATFSQLVQEAAEDGGAPTELFIDARTLIAALEQEGLSREQLEQALPSVAEQIEIAAALESDIVIPIGEATAALAGTGLEAVLAQNARTREDALSMAEADALDAELLQQLEVEAARVMKEQTDKQAWENDAREVFDTLIAELGNAGRFSPDVNRAYATLLRNFYATTASRLGTTPTELYARFPLRVSSRAPGARTNVLDQYASSVTTGARPGELTVEGVHFSAGRREVLDGSFYGTGARGAESARLAELPADSPLRRRVYAYVDEGAGVRPEQGVGSTAHAVTLQNIYDTGKDPLGIWTGDANTREQAVLDAGFDGYYVPGSMAAGQGRTQGTVVALGDAAQAIPTREYAPGGVSAAQEQLSPERQALEELYNDSRIPSGMMTPRRLGERVQRMRPDLYEILEPTGLFEGETEAYKADIIAAARYADVFAQSLSTRLPTAVKAAEDPLNAVLNITFDVALSDTKTLAKNMAALSATPNMRKLTGRGAKDPVRQAEAFIEHVKGNLLWLHDHMPQEWRERAKLWYDGGRKTIDLWSRRYGTSQMQGAAVIAVMSPQNGWFANVSQAERVMDLVFGARDVRWDDAMTAEAERISGEGGPDANMQAAMGKTLGELLDTPEVAARWIRVYDQTHNNRAYRVLTPEGGVADYVKTGAGNDATMKWKSYATIAKAVSVLVDGRAENVHYQLGKEHKVRNFYNNLLEPHSELGFATIDTHAVAAALLRPLASSDTEVLQAFGGTGAASSSVTGLRGTYPIYLEAYRRAAEERGIQAREMQSITWEAVRGLFEAAKKSGLKKKANAIWERYKSGEIEQEQAQQEILELAGDITPPDWTAVEFNDQPARTYEGPIQREIDERGEVGAQENDTTVVFEVAPDPNDAELTARWNALDDAERLRLSIAVAQEIVPKVLKEFSTDGEFSVQLGGYLGATNPSLTLRLEHPELAVQIAKAMGHILSQDSMVVVSPVAIAGTDPVGSVTLSLPEGMGAAEVAELYDRLWALEDNGEKLVGGHTTADGQMAILNFTGLDTAELARRIDEHLGGAFEVAIDEVFAAFPQREDYGYGSDRPEGATAPAQSSVQKRIDNIRTEAGQLLEAGLAELDRAGTSNAGRQDVLNQGEITDGRDPAAGNGAGRYSSGSLAPLEGAPLIEGATGPDPRLVAVAEQYAADNGIELHRQSEYVEVDPERAARIAAAYEAMPHAPQDPAVKEAFENLIQQTMAQYQALAEAGYQFYFFDETNDPYGGNPWNAMRDLRANQTMGVFATEAGFGSGATELNVEDNPMLADTGLVWPYGSPDGEPKRVLANDLFRAVHDAFGHGLEGAGFRARGEENAWQAHVRLFTGSAVGAITTETRGQNSWLNYGPYGEQNRNAKVEDTIFADQKTGLMPEWTWTEGRAADAAPEASDPAAPREVFNQSVPQTETEAFKRWFGDSKVVDADGKPLVVYHGTTADFSAFDPERVGERFGLDQDGFFFTGNTITASGFADPQSQFLAAGMSDPDALGRSPRSGANVMPVYLSLQNPLTLDEYTYAFDTTPKREIDDAGLSLIDYFDDNRRSVVAYAKEGGYDGVLFQRNGQTFAVAFRPVQIKSAIGNRGTFDPADPNILHQSAQADTPAFKRWFGDSKAVDFVNADTGAPIVSSKEPARAVPKTMYHTTLADFEAFEVGRSTVNSGTFGSWETERHAIFVTPDIHSSQAYGTRGGVFADGANVMPLYIKAENPLDLTEGVSEEAFSKLEQAGMSPRYILNTLGHWEMFDDDGGRDVVEMIKAAGYDSVIFNDENPDTGESFEAWAVFDPVQIKSAIGNRGTFDPADPNILHQSAQTETDAFRAWFGDSKVVDENGEPLVVYHGTAADFDVFDPSLLGTRDAGFYGSGFYFTPELDDAADYADSAVEDAGGGDANVVEVYVALQNPFVWDMSWDGEGADATRAALAEMGINRDSTRGDANALGNPDERRKFNEAVRAAGHDGVIVRDEDGIREVVAFRPEQIKSAIGNNGNFDPADPNIYNQSGQARATFNPATLEIALLEKADLSSFLHETGHFFFEMLGTLATEPGAPQPLRDDMQLLLDHIGFKGTIEEWVKLSVNERREGHETIAETFEQYLFTGKAPTAEMQSLFRRFKSWLIAVYRSLQDFLDGNERASLTPEVQGVFDRLIATEEEIKAAQAVREFQPLFEEQGAMPQEEWEAYQLSIEQHQAEALESLQSRALRDMKWLDNAKSRKLRELQREADARRKGLRDEVTAEIEAEPVYAAMEFLKHGRLQTDGEEIQIAENRAHKLNIDAVEALFPEGDLGQPVDWKKLGYGKYGMLSKDGLPPDVVAEMFGFKSGRDLVTSLLNAEPKAAAINGLTDQRMLERYGDLSSPAAMREAANEALANEARARMVATELKAVAQLTGSPAALARAARATAERIVAARKVRNLRPDLAAAAANRARKAAERAMASGDTAAAAAAKRTEILNVQLERAERAAQKEHDKALRSFQKINKGTNEKIAKSRDVDLVNAARAVLARYGLAPRGAAINAQNYMELLSTYNGAMAEDLRSMLQGLPPTMDFRDMTVEQFNGMRDIVNGLYYLSKRTKQMEIDGEKVEIDAVADEIVAGVLDHTGGELPPLPGYTNTTTRADEWKVGLLGAKASLMRVEAWADAMGAPFKKYIWQPVSEAITRAKVRRNDMVKQYLELLKGIEKGLTYDKINAPELGSAGFTFNKGKTELLHAVLHTGNESNLRKLLLGRGWGTLREDGSLDTSRWDAFMARMYAEGTITKADMEFVQGVWDLLETVKADAQRAHKEMYGYYFSEITANPVQTPWGEYRGGYVPAIADTLSSPDAAQKREQEELLHSGNSFMFPTTGKGFTMSRVEYNRPLALDLRSIGMHLDKVARFAYIEPAVRDVGKLLTNRRVARALNGYDQTLISSMLNPWLQRSARQNVNAPGKNPKVDKFFNELRTRSGMVLMFGNVVNTLQQFTGFSLAAVKVPAHRLLRANMRYITNHFEVVENARTLSPWLADRMDNHSFEMMGQIDKILLDPNPVKHAAEYLRRNAYFMQQGVQNVLDIIVWTGAYDHAVAKGASQKDAVRYADETVRMTQGSFAPEDVSAFEVQSPFVRLFTQFYGYFNMWGNLLGAEGKKALKDAGFVKASPRLLFLWFVGMAIPAFVAELIAAGAPDEEDDEDGDGLLDEWLAMFFGAQAKSVAAMVPVAGQISVLGANYMDDKVYNDRLNISPAVSLIESAVYGGTAALSGELFDEDLTKKEMRSALILTGMTFGVPVGPLMRAGGYAIDEAEGRKEADNALEYGAGLLLGR